MNIILKYFKEKRKLFLSWLFSYIFIIVISLLISSVAYIKSVNIIKAEINESYYAMLKQLQQSIDTKLSDIEKIMTTIMLDKNIKEQSNIKNPGPMYHISLRNAIDTIKTCEIANSFIEDIFVYDPERKIIVSGNGTCGDTEYFDIYYPGKIKDKAGWNNFLKQKHIKELFPVSALNPGKPDLNGVLFLQSISYDSVRKDYITLGIVLNKEFLEESLKSFSGISDGNSIIVNGQNELVAALNKKLDFHVEDFHLQGSHGIQEYTNGTNPVELVYIRSGVSDWQYIAIIPRLVFDVKAKEITNIILLCTLLCLAGGVITAVVFARKNYNPVDNLIQNFSKLGKLKFDKKVNEFKMIENSMLAMINENKSIARTLEKQKPVVKNNFLNKLVKGYIMNRISLDDMCRTYGIEFKGESFVLVLFSLEEPGVAYSSEQNGNEEKAMELAYFVIENVMEELIRQEHDCSFFSVDQTAACLINPGKSGSNPMDILDGIKEIILSGKKIIMDNFSIVFTASVSNIHALDGIPEAYRECQEAAEYKLVIGSNNIILYKDIHSFGGNGFSNAYPIGVQQQFINCIRADDFVQARQVMEHIFRENFLNTNISLDMARCLMFAIINTMVNAINDIYTAVDSKFLEELNPVQKLIRCKSVFEMQKQMGVILTEIENYNHAKKEGGNSNRTRDITAYIHNHYYDHDLSVSSIAEEFSMNPVYLSRFFKEQTGEGVLNTINKTRMEKAKMLLKDNDLNIKDISEMVGFLNSTVFIRTFRKYEGVTPGKYRELCSVEDRG